MICRLFSWYKDTNKEGENYMRLLKDTAHIDSVAPEEVPLELDSLLNMMHLS